MPSNTTNEQDEVISMARKGLVIEVEKLVEIIDDLDKQITNWMIATDCETPKHAMKMLSKMRSVDLSKY